MHVRWPAVLAAVFASGVRLAHAQEPTPSPTPASKPSSDSKRQGVFHIGPLFITPTLRIGAIGVDTNVFYTATDRRTDMTASGGPGLIVTVPFSEATRLTASGEIGYLYFLRTESQRRLDHSSLGKFEWKGSRTETLIAETYRTTFNRPNFEVDRRITQTQEATRADFNRRLFGRTGIAIGLERSRTEVEPGEKFLGTDLGRTLTDRRLTGRVGLEYGVTFKTRLQAEAMRSVTRFPLARERDGQFDHLRAGIRTSSSALISGSVLAGVGWFRLRRTPQSAQRFFSAEADATWHVSPRTRIGGSYQHLPRYSAFDTEGRNPTVRTEVIGARIEKELVGTRLDLRLTGTITHHVTDEPVAVTLDSGEVMRARRDDTFRTASADLGYRIRSRLRAGLMAGYASRRSTIADLGIEGLIVGATVTVNP